MTSTTDRVAPADLAPSRGWSLRLRLTVLTAGLLCLTLAAGAVVLTTVLARGRMAALDEIVTERATTVSTLVSADRVPAALPVAEPGEIAQLLDASGRVIASSTNASRTLPVLPPDAVAALRAPADRPVVVSTDASAYDGEARVAAMATSYRGDPATVVVTVPVAEMRGLIRALQVSLVAVVPVLTAMLAAAIWLVLGRALHPVEQLRRAAAGVARSGGPGLLPVPRAQDELGALARTLNEMLDRLDAAAARQRTLVADAAHELRSPLASLRAAVEVAQAHPDSYRSAELAEDLAGDVLRMQALVDDLLLLARVGSTALTRTDLDLADVAQDAVAASRAAASTSVTVTVTGAGTARGDGAAVTRVVRNLVDNAVRHARSRVVVEVSDGVVVVADDGNGIPAPDRERVFERFVRLDEAREREAGGSGLGLAIAREIAREHGGDVVLDAAEGSLGGLRATALLPPAEGSDGGPGGSYGEQRRPAPTSGPGH